MKLYEENVLLALKTKVGRPIKVYIWTIEASYGNFVEVSVKINLNQTIMGTRGTCIA